MLSRIQLVGCLIVLTRIPAGAEEIQWFSDAGNSNQDSSGLAMDAGYSFELGVFSGGFVPTASNISLWRSKWVAADSAAYNVTNNRFTGIFTVTDNLAPFAVGTQAWIFGYRDTPSGSEWILFRKSTWIWPVPNPFNPTGPQWNTKDADQVVAGIVNSSGTPVLMKSVAVQCYDQWRNSQLAGEPMNGPDDDPDHDGTSNLLEFVFGAAPKQAGAPPATAVAITTSHSQLFLQISVPRLRNRLVTVVVEVSGDLVTWQSGADHTEEITNTATLLVIRDRTPSGPGTLRRFMRARVVVTP